MQATQPQFSAVVVSFHTGPILEACIDALADAPLCRQIVLVNNGNPPDVVAALHVRAAKVSKLKLIDGHGNIGFGRACNLGAAQASEDYLLFVNPDCVIDATCLSALASVLADHSDALVGGSLRNVDGSEQRGTRRGVLTPWSALVSFSGLGRPGLGAGIWRDFNRIAEPVPTETLDMPVISGALMAMRAKAFTAIGGFDPAFFLHVEDIDLCQRVRASGARVLYAPDAKAVHIGATSNATSWAIERAKIASFGHYFWKNARMFWDYIGVILLMPVIACAIIMRLLFTSKQLFR